MGGEVYAFSPLITRGWANSKFIGRGPSATLVEGPHDAHLEWHGPTGYDVDYRVDCAIKDGVSDCTCAAWLAINASTATTWSVGFTETVSARAFAVQVTGTGVPAAEERGGTW